MKASVQFETLTCSLLGGGLGPPNPIQETKQRPRMNPDNAPFCLTRLKRTPSVKSPSRGPPTTPNIVREAWSTPVPRMSAKKASDTPSGTISPTQGAEDVDEARKKRKCEVMVDVESSTRENSNPLISTESNESVEVPLMIENREEEIKIVAEVNNSNPGDVQNKAKPMEDQPKPKASKEEKVNAEESLVRDIRYIDKYGMSWQLVQTDHFLKMVLCPLCPIRPSGKVRATQLKLANLQGHLRKVHALNCQKFLILRCPDCEENVSAPSLHRHLIEHKTHNSSNSNCQPVAGKTPRPARKIWVKKDIFVPGVLADKSI